MSRANKAKAGRYERNTAAVFQEAGFPEADRDRQRGARDEGDICGVDNLTIECKNRKRLDVAGAVDEAIEEMKHKGTDWAIAAIKRRGKHARESYAVQPLQMAAEKHRELTKLSVSNRRLRKLFEIVREYVDSPIGDHNREHAARLRRRMRRAMTAVELGDQAVEGL